MSKWIPCGEDFEIGDVVRWTEGIWHEHGRRKKNKRKVVKTGTCEVTGQVETRDRKGFQSLTVLKCEIIETRYGVPVEPFKKGEAIRRKRNTIGRGGGEKLVQPDPPKPKVQSRFLRGH